jgi:CHAT domain-containing protein
MQCKLNFPLRALLVLICLIGFEARASTNIKIDTGFVNDNNRKIDSSGEADIFHLKRPSSSRVYYSSQASPEEDGKVISVFSLLEKARTQRDDGKYKDSLDSLMAAIPLLDGISNPTEKDLVSLPVNMSLYNTLMMMKEYNNAKQAIDKVIQVLEKEGFSELIIEGSPLLGTAPFSAYYKAALASRAPDRKDAISLLDKGILLLGKSKFGNTKESDAFYSNYADLYANIGHNEKAINIYSMLASRIAVERKEAENPEYAYLLDKLAGLYMVGGNNGTAELLIQGAISIYSKDIERYWYDIQWAKVVLFKLRNKLDEAIKIAEEVRHRAFNENNKPQVLKSYAIQFEFADQAGNDIAYRKAIQRFNSLPQDYFDRKLFQEFPHDFLIVSNSITRRYLRAGKIEEARSMLDSAALDIALTEIGMQNFLTLKTLLLLAQTDELLDINRAIRMYKKIASISRENGLLIQTIASLRRLSHLEAKNGNITGAIEGGIAHSSVYIDFLFDTLPLLSREERINTVGSFNSDVLHTLSLDHASSIGPSLSSAINERGLLNHIDLSQKNLEQSQKQIQVLKRLGDLNSLKAEANSDSSTNLSTDIRNNELLYNQLSSFKPARRFINAKELLSALPVNSTYVHVVKFRKLEFINSREPLEHYGAYVVSNADESFVHIGKAVDIDKTIGEGLRSFRENLGGTEQILHKVYLESFERIFRQIKTGSRVFISLDSEMNTLPIGSLYVTKDSNVTLADIFDITLVSSPRDLILGPGRSSTEQQSAPAIIVDPLYSSQKSNIAIGSRNGKLDVARDESWSQLKYAGNEGKSVKAIIGGDLYDKHNASKETLRNLNSPKILHIAAHAFFRSVPISNEGQKPVYHETSLYRNVEHYLRKSGIALSVPEGSLGEIDDAGILTAGEAAYLDLRNTDLVVLSACSTGEGVTTNGLGVFGLYRSFIEAGAKSVLISLWRVDDEATAEFMVEFYKELKSGKSKTEALKITQKAFREGRVAAGKWKEPYYWAAWQLVGDWRPIKDL